MSILIKGMEMPECCVECWFKICEKISATDKNLYWYKHIYNCRYKPEEIEDGWIDAPEALNGRQPWCPLWEVPTPHGRLIDADEFEKYVELEYETREISHPNWIKFRVWCGDQPTVIEAEGRE